MASGIGLNPSVVDEFNAMKIRHTSRFLVFSIRDNREVVIESRGAPSATYDEFLSQLPHDDCRYVVYDLEYSTEDGRPQNKLVFFHWAPESSKVKAKMVYASTKENVKRSLPGIYKEVQATDLSEVDHAAVVAAMLSNK
eukprot:GILI01000626.1.p1 GENE.GILI01000626.1~~GILI01000626.1.p1  ORF type:complete len:139 (-),score=34.93 GILI01000626.1:123-539(-)